MHKDRSILRCTKYFIYIYIILLTNFNNFSKLVTQKLIFFLGRILEVPKKNLKGEKTKLVIFN